MTVLKLRYFDEFIHVRKTSFYFYSINADVVKIGFQNTCNGWMRREICSDGQFCYLYSMVHCVF